MASSCAAGTGGTSATLARYVRYRRHATEVVVADPENSVFFDYFTSRDRTLVHPRGSRIEGIGRPRVEASFLRDVDRRDGRGAGRRQRGRDALAAATLGRRVGGSTGTILYGALRLLQRMHARGEPGSVVALICDGGERYAHSYYNDAWLAAEGLDPEPHLARIRAFAERGEPQAWPVREARACSPSAAGPAPAG